MKKTLLTIATGMTLLATSIVHANERNANPEQAQPRAASTVDSFELGFDYEAVNNVNWNNYSVAESDWNFLKVLEDVPVNTWIHDAPVSMENQTVIRSNRDVAYSLAVVDVSKGAVFNVPAENNDYFQIIHIIDENHMTHKVVRRGETVRITPEDLTGGNHVYLLARTRDMGDVEDLKRRQNLMQFITNSSQPYEAKGFKEEDVIKYREKLIASAMKGSPILAVKGFGSDWADIDFHHFNMVSAYGWGGLKSDIAQYLDAAKLKGESPECSEWRIPTPDLNEALGGYWSLTTYGGDGWIAKDNFYIGNDRMKDNGDGTTSLFVNCSDHPEYAKHSVDVVDGWAGLVRFYEPTDWKANVEYLETIRNTPLVPVK
ncbi:DUF1254 domain-containing protein [Vibrio fortis]|uniref:DUF1254 domain-containing protein n=1 Tax=Vibrio fortis TaxID=212667 RepID=UPI0021C2F56C|nr:DUF1254 domain-containing protein [Vibrio fortis]